MLFSTKTKTGTLKITTTKSAMSIEFPLGIQYLEFQSNNEQDNHISDFFSYIFCMFGRSEPYPKHPIQYVHDFVLFFFRIVLCYKNAIATQN